MPTKKAKADVTIQPIDLGRLQIKIVGDSPLLVHAWSEKAKREILDKQMKKAKQAKQAKDTHADYLASRYMIEEDADNPEGGVHGFPLLAFKNAAVDACSQVDGFTKVNARAAFHLQGGVFSPKHSGPLLPLEFDTVEMSEDMVRIGMGTADIRYRAMYHGWSAVLDITHNRGVLSAEQIVNLFEMAGFGIGVGEWRPQRNGQHGTFHVESA